MSLTVRDIAVAHARSQLGDVQLSARGRARGYIDQAARASDHRLARHYLLCAWRCMRPRVRRRSIVGAVSPVLSPREVVRAASMVSAQYAALVAAAAPCSEDVRSRVSTARDSWMQDVAPTLAPSSWGPLVPNASALVWQEAQLLVQIAREVDACLGARSTLAASVARVVRDGFEAVQEPARSAASWLGLAAAAVVVLVIMKGK